MTTHEVNKLAERLAALLCATCAEIARDMTVSANDADRIREGWIENAIAEAEQNGFSGAEITAAIAAADVVQYGPAGEARRRECWAD